MLKIIDFFGVYFLKWLGAVISAAAVAIFSDMYLAILPTHSAGYLLSSFGYLRVMLSGHFFIFAASQKVSYHFRFRTLSQKAKFAVGCMSGKFKSVHNIKYPKAFFKREAVYSRFYIHMNLIFVVVLLPNSIVSLVLSYLSRSYDTVPYTYF